MVEPMVVNELNNTRHQCMEFNPYIFYVQNPYKAERIAAKRSDSSGLFLLLKKLIPPEKEARRWNM